MLIDERLKNKLKTMQIQTELDMNQDVLLDTIINHLLDANNHAHRHSYVKITDLKPAETQTQFNQRVENNLNNLLENDPYITNALEDEYDPEFDEKLYQTTIDILS